MMGQKHNFADISRDARGQQQAVSGHSAGIRIGHRLMRATAVTPLVTSMPPGVDYYFIPMSQGFSIDSDPVKGIQ